MKVLQGTFRADRHGDELTVPTKWPDPPASVNARERILWAELEKKCAAWVAASDVLAIYGVVTLVDLIQRNEDAQQETPESRHPLLFTRTLNLGTGEIFETQAPGENPLFTQRVKILRELRAYLGIMGLSPVDRARVETPGGAEPTKNPLDRFLNRKRG